MSTDKPKDRAVGEGGSKMSARPGSAMSRVSQRAKDVEEKLSKQLPIWANELRSAPNETLRSALFTARNKVHPRARMNSEEIVTYGNAKILYTGEELRQDDLDVWLQILHMAKDLPLGEPIYFKANEFKREIKMPYGNESTLRLKEAFTRLKATAVTVHSERLGKGVSVSLISRFEYTDELDSRTGEWMVAVEPEMAALFGGGVYLSQFEWEQRRQLKGPLAKWLHGFYSSHRDPFDLPVSTIMGNTGTSIATNKKATQLMKSALTELVRVKFLDEFSIDSKGKVHVVRTKR